MKKAGSFLLVAGVFLLFSCNHNHSGNKKNRGKTVSETVVRHPLVVMKTKFGTITAELYPEKAPLTVANFERYIRENRLKDATGQ